jgi:hypothetical protein
MTNNDALDLWFADLSTGELAWRFGDRVYLFLERSSALGKQEL